MAIFQFQNRPLVTDSSRYVVNKRSPLEQYIRTDIFYISSTLSQDYIYIKLNEIPYAIDTIHIWDTQSEVPIKNSIDEIAGIKGWYSNDDLIKVGYLALGVYWQGVMEIHITYQGIGSIVCAEDINELKNGDLFSPELRIPNNLHIGDITIGPNGIDLKNKPILENGNEIMKIVNGNVGIGVASPSQKLHIAGNIGLQAGTNAFIGTLDTYALSLRTNNTDRIWITNDGNVGIGTTSPSEKLTVNGNISILTDGGLIKFYGGSMLGKVYGADVRFIPGYAGANFEFRNYGNTATNMIITSGGNVGIGTTSPSQKLHVAGNIGLQSGANAFIGTLDNYALSLRTNNADRVWIANNGNVGIGTTSPSQKLHVAGNIGLQSGANAFIGTLDNYALSLRTNNSDRVWIANNGNVGIGTTSPTENLHVVGNIYFSNLLKSGNGVIKYDTDGKWKYSNDGVNFQEIGSGGSSNLGFQTLTFSNPLNWNASLGSTAKIVLTGNTILNSISNAVAGNLYYLIVQQDAIGGRTISFGSNFKWSAGYPPSNTTTPNAVDVYTFLFDGTNYYAVVQNDFR